MKQVAKLLILDSDNKYLLLYRSQHPTFGNDPDLPGGTLEAGELPLETMLREVQEEIGVTIARAGVQAAYSGAEYSAHGTHYSFFITKLPERPSIVMSWEHAAHEWLDRDSFLEEAKNANDTYMHMVHDVLRDFDL